jgi:hypothetical protein
LENSSKNSPEYLIKHSPVVVLYLIVTYSHSYSILAWLLRVICAAGHDSVSTPLLYYFTEQLDSDTIGSHDLGGREVSSLAEQSRQKKGEIELGKGERALDLEREARGGEDQR